MWCWYFAPLGFPVYACKHELNEFTLLEQLRLLGSTKGRKGVGNAFTNRELLYFCTFSCQRRLWSDCALSVLTESWHMPRYFSQPFPAWIETTVPVLSLDDCWDDYKLCKCEIGSHVLSSRGHWIYLLLLDNVREALTTDVSWSECFNSSSCSSGTWFLDHPSLLAVQMNSFISKTTFACCLLSSISLREMPVKDFIYMKSLWLKT